MFKVDKKVLILVMTCELPQYKRKEEVIRQTWAKDVLEKKYENVDLYFFTSGEENKIDKDNNKIYVKCNDLRDRTFQKMMKTMNLIDEENIEYDYIVRVNTSTYINVIFLLDIINKSPDSTYLYSGAVFLQPWVANRSPFLSGECFVLSKHNVAIAQNFYKKNLEYFNKLEYDPRKDTKWVCDDGWLTIIYRKVYKELYFAKIHSLGIVYTNGDDVEYEDEIKTYPLICYKTVQKDDSTDLDKTPIYDDIDEKKLFKIHQIVEKENKKYSSNEDLVDWYVDYIIDIYDQSCYSLESVLKTQFTKRIFTERISKYELLKLYSNIVK